MENNDDQLRLSVRCSRDELDEIRTLAFFMREPVSRMIRRLINQEKQRIIDEDKSILAFFNRPDKTVTESD